MRLLLDQNLSPRLVAALVELYPDSRHVREVGLASAQDDVVWRYAVEHHLTIVSKDADFHERSFLLGHPPKVIWIRRGNCSTDEALALLRSEHESIVRFEADEGFPCGHVELEQTVERRTRSRGRRYGFSAGGAISSLSWSATPLRLVPGARLPDWHSLLALLMYDAGRDTTRRVVQARLTPQASTH